jgi:hypothetical protein
VWANLCTSKNVVISQPRTLAEDFRSARQPRAVLETAESTGDSDTRLDLGRVPVRLFGSGRYSPAPDQARCGRPRGSQVKPGVAVAMTT